MARKESNVFVEDTRDYLQSAANYLEALVDGVSPRDEPPFVDILRETADELKLSTLMEWKEGVEILSKAADRIETLEQRNMSLPERLRDAADEPTDNRQYDEADLMRDAADTIEYLHEEYDTGPREKPTLEDIDQKLDRLVQETTSEATVTSRVCWIRQILNEASGLTFEAVLCSGRNPSLSVECPKRYLDRFQEVFDSDQVLTLWKHRQDDEVELYIEELEVYRKIDEDGTIVFEERQEVPWVQ
jgi:hypothetical protein